MSPNILFILADDLGWADLSGGRTTLGGGSDFYETPNLDRLAREGMAFTAAYTCPNCTPSRAALLSGQYSTRTRVYAVDNLNRGNGTPPLLGPNQNEDVPAGLTTLAEMLKASGYTTAHVGKYHVGGHEGGVATLPLNQGFDFNYGGGADGNPGAYHATEVSAGTWQFHANVGPELDPFAAPYDDAYRLRYRTMVAPSNALPASLLGTPKHVGDAVTDAALSFMESHHASSQPFYLQYHQYLVHTPRQARADLKAKYDAKKLTQPSLMGHGNTTYAGMVEQFDQNVGRLLAYLNDPNGDGNTTDSIATNTLVIFVSDNGGEDGSTSNFPLRAAKGTFYEGGLRVPLIAWMPGTVPAGATNHTPVILLDFYRTLADFAGATLPNQIAQPLDGVSLAPLFRGQTNTLPERALYWHFPGYLDTRATPCSTIIKRSGGQRFKLLYFYETQRWSLYNLTADLGETTDLFATLAGQNAHWSAATNLSADLRQWLEATGAIYPTNRITGLAVPPPTAIAGLPPAVPPANRHATINVHFVHSSDLGTGPSGFGLSGVFGRSSPTWNTYTDLDALKWKQNLLDEDGRNTPVMFLNNAPKKIAIGSNTNNESFASDGSTNGFFYSYCYLSAGGTPGTPATNQLAIGGLIPGNEYDLVLYATWNWADAGSTFTISGVSKTATGVPSTSTAPLVEGQSYVRFDSVRPDEYGAIVVDWATYVPAGGAHRGPLNAMQIRGDFGQRFGDLMQTRIVALEPIQNRLTLSWESRTNHTYTILCSTNLQNWSVVSPNINSAGDATSTSLPLTMFGDNVAVYVRVREN